jgi:hypothetical protein
VKDTVKIAWGKTETYENITILFYIGRFKKKVTLSHVNNEVTSEPTIT